VWFKSTPKIDLHKAEHGYILIVGWKPILYWLFGPKNQSFRNKSGKTQPIRTKFNIRGHVKGLQRSGNFGRDRPILGKMGAGTSHAEREFFCSVLNHATYRQLCNGRFSPNFILVTKRSSVSRRGIWKDIFENFHWNRKSVKQAPHSEQATGHVIHCRDNCLLHVVVQGPGSFRRSVNFSVRRTVAKLFGVKIAQFSYFGIFSPYKTPKTYLPVTSLQPRGYIAECFRYGYIHTECNCTARQIWTRDVWKRAILRTDVLSHQISSPLPPKSPQNSILGTFQCKTYYTDTSP